MARSLVFRIRGLRIPRLIRGVSSLSGANRKTDQHLYDETLQQRVGLTCGLGKPCPAAFLSFISFTPTPPPPLPSCALPPSLRSFTSGSALFPARPAADVPATVFACGSTGDAPPWCKLGCGLALPALFLAASPSPSEPEPEPPPGWLCVSLPVPGRRGSVPAPGAVVEGSTLEPLVYCLRGSLKA